MVKFILKLIQELLALKFMPQNFKGYLMLKTLLNCLKVLINPETSLEPFVGLELVFVVII